MKLNFENHNKHLLRSFDINVDGEKILMQGFTREEIKEKGNYITTAMNR